MYFLFYFIIYFYTFIYLFIFILFIYLFCKNKLLWGCFLKLASLFFYMHVMDPTVNFCSQKCKKEVLILNY